MELSGAIRSYNVNIGNLALQICDIPDISDAMPVPEGYHTLFYYQLFFSICGEGRTVTVTLDFPAKYGILKHK